MHDVQHHAYITKWDMFGWYWHHNAIKVKDIQSVLRHGCIESRGTRLIALLK